MPEFTHLHVHTMYSLLDGSGRITEMIKRTKELGMDSIAITDHGVMYGIIDFYKAAKEEGIKPIIGCEVYVAPGSRFEKENVLNESKYNHLILLAENKTGYENLMKIVSIGFTEGFYYKPRVDHEILEKYHEGIIALSACLAGEVQRALAAGFYDEGKEAALRLQNIFGKNNFFLELQDHGIPAQKQVNASLVRMSGETGIDLVCTNDVHYIYAEDAAPHDALLCIQTGKKLADEVRMRYEGGQFFLKSPGEMRELFPNIPKALENTVKIAERCNVEITFHEQKLPRYDYPDKYPSALEYLKELCAEGMKKRYNIDTHPDREALDQRLEHELNVIESMGYVDYFLIVWDYIRFAKDNDIPVGPGRGSAAGSIVSYCLEITDLDPIKYNLVFERFLNPERVSMPDIDVDFCYERRQEVIDYVVEKYGRDCVAQIVTFGTMAARAAIKDVGRVMDIPFAKVDETAKMIPEKPGATITEALETNPDFKKTYEEDIEVRSVVDTALRLEGLPRHTSVHAAGVVICDRPLVEYVPVALGSDGELVSEFTMTTLEELGLLKMDFLGLRTLTVIKDAENLIKIKNPDFSINNIDIADKKVFDYISTGKCDGIFQLESAGMKSFMKELRPGNLEDLIAGISLYRPGPMDFIPQYIKGKNDPDSIKYACPQLEPILNQTYGCIVYQEQVMQIVRDLAGFSWGRSDNVRRAMSKKQTEKMEKERIIFIEGDEEAGVKGCVANGIPREVAAGIYDDMIDFAKYAFNKSHAACYAAVSYQTAFLKTYYPVEYMAALMTSVMDSTDKVSRYIYDCKQIGIGILPPDINKSLKGFSVENGSIRYGLYAIKSMGKNTIEAIMKSRDEDGDFLSLNDFARRMSGDINCKNMESLIKSGALDSFGHTRRGMMNINELLLESESRKNKNQTSGQMSFMDFLGDDSDNSGSADLAASMEVKVPDAPEFELRDILDYEKEMLGIYVSGHPLDDEANIWKRCTTAASTDFREDKAAGVDMVVKDKRSYTVGGIISGISKIVTRNGQNMCFITLEDVLDTLEIVVFPQTYSRYRELLAEGERVFITGKANVDATGDQAKLLADTIVKMDDVPRKLWIRFESEEEYKKQKSDLENLLGIGGEDNSSDRGSGGPGVLEDNGNVSSEAGSVYYGRDNVIVYCEKEKTMDKWPDTKKTRVTGHMLTSLKNKYGAKNIEMT